VIDIADIPGKIEPPRREEHIAVHRKASQFNSEAQRRKES
jgi:hypothetical protein